MGSVKVVAEAGSLVVVKLQAATLEVESRAAALGLHNRPYLAADGQVIPHLRVGLAVAPD